MTLRVTGGPVSFRPDTGVSVVVITYHSADVIAGCLRSLPAALDGVPDSEVIVVDNASGDDTRAVAKAALPSARVLAQETNGGYAAGVNAGIAAAASGHAILVLNPDIRLAPASVRLLLQELGDEPGIIVPRLTDEHGTRHPSLRREPSVLRTLADGLLGGARAGRIGALSETITDPAAYVTGAEADWATGAAMLIDPCVLDDIGVFDESFFLYSEETEFMLRARDAGYPTRFVAEAVAVHLGGEQGTSPHLWALSRVNRVKLHRRRRGRVSTAAMLAVSLMAEVLRALTGRSTSRHAVGRLLRSGFAIVLGAPPVPTPAVPAWICFSAQDWWYFNRAHSDFQLMTRVAQRRPMLFVNSIAMRMPMPGRSTNVVRKLGRKAASIGRMVRRPLPDVPGFHVMTPVPFPFYGSALTRRFNAWFVRTQVRVATRVLGMTGPGRPDPVISVTIPTAFPAAASLPHRALVMNRSDKYSAFREADNDAIRAIELDALARCDRVFYSAAALAQDEADLVGERATILDHGVDVELFSPNSSDAMPADMAALPGPRIGFFGNLRANLVDFDLIAAVAEALPDASVVLVGPVNSPLGRLTELPNVHVLGPKPHEAIPAYGRGFDVALMPWHDNEWIRHANPIKLKEYLALGLPVVSTDFPEVRRYRDLIRIADGRAAFVAAVAQTLNDGGPASPAQRRAAVADATWDRAALRFLREAESSTALPATNGLLRPGAPAEPGRPGQAFRSVS